MTTRAKSIAQTTGAGSLSFFDARPIAAFEGLVLKARSVEFGQTVSKEAWAAAVEFAASAHEASPYWVGDLLAFAETRAEWADYVTQFQSSLGLAHQTLLNRTYVAKHVSPEVRALAPTMGHAAEVASMLASEQAAWMTKARDHDLSSSELRREIRASKRRGVIEGQAVLAGQYRVIYADPPWAYGSGTRGGSRVEDHYPTMTIDEMCKLPVAAHSTPDAVLFLWCPAPILLQNPGPRDVIEAWGFTPKSNIVWDKVRGIGGSYVYVRHEHLIIATRGSATADYEGASTGEGGEGMMQSVHVERRTGQHSEKPETFRKAIERMYTHGPRLELFARERVQGWDSLGSDARSWAAEAQR